MKELKRYGIKDNGDYYEREDGEWVSADDAHSALEAAEAREAELEGMVPKKWHLKLLRNAVIEYRKRAEFDPNDPYKDIDFLENCEDCIEWLDALIATSKEEV